MRNKNWLRYGLASASIVGLMMGAGLAACGDDDSATPGGGTDGGPDGTGTGDTGGGGNDTGTPDTSKPETSTPTPAKILVAHGAHDYGGHTDDSGAVRVCYATQPGGTGNFGVSPLAPLPHSVEDGGRATFPGIPIGAGGPFPSTGVPLEQIAIRPYILSAQSLAVKGITGNTGAAVNWRCPQLLASASVTPDGGWPDGGGTNPFVENQDYWKLGDIPVGTFKNNKTYVLAITGCTSDTAAAYAAGGKCGPALDAGTPYVPTATPGPGNLGVIVMEIDAATTVAADELGVQVAHLSPQYDVVDSLSPGVPPFKPVVGNAAAADAGKGVTPDAVTFNPKATAPTALVKIKGITTASGFFAINGADPSNPSVPFGAQSMNNAGGTQPTIQYISEGKTTPNAAEYIVNGKAYTFIFLGDPSLAAAAGLRRAHFLAFPSNFTPPPAQ